MKRNSFSFLLVRIGNAHMAINLYLATRLFDSKFIAKFTRPSYVHCCYYLLCNGLCLISLLLMRHDIKSESGVHTFQIWFWKMKTLLPVAAGIKNHFALNACAYNILTILLLFSLSPFFCRLMAVCQPIKELRIWYNYGYEHRIQCKLHRLRHWHTHLNVNCHQIHISPNTQSRVHSHSHSRATTKNSL